MNIAILLHNLKPVFEIMWISIWTVWVAANTSKNWKTYKKMFEWQEPNKWPKLVKHTSLTYCEDCDPPPQPRDGEEMYCPKCDTIMANHKIHHTTGVGINTVHTSTEITKDWFCPNCQDMWPDAAARKFQTAWHREETRKQRALREQAAQSAEAAGFHQAGSAGWTSYKFHEQPISFRPSIVHSGGQGQYQGFPYAGPAKTIFPSVFDTDLVKSLAMEETGVDVEWGK